MHSSRFPFVVFLLLLSGLSPWAAESDPARLTNIATRAQIGGSAGTPIAGFVLGGSSTKTMLARAAGPALTGFGVSGALADPGLSLLSGVGTVASNDNWLAADAATMTAAGAFAFTAGSKDAALVATLAPGAYTAPVSASGTTTGVTLLEIYDASATTATASVVNASTRAFVGTGDAVLIPGFVISGTGSLRLLIRAVGPTLSTFGLTGLLADPTITLYRGTTALATNDNWSSAVNAAEISAAATAVGAFALPAGSKDAAMVTSLPAGSYTAVVSGVGNTTGTALVELYSNVPAFTGTPTSAPAVAITSPAAGLTTALATLMVQGTSSGAPGGVTSVTVNAVAATSTDNFATWVASVPLGFGTNALTATATTSAGTATTTAPVIATSTATPTYNPLIIPDTISGTTFDLALAQTSKQFRAGAATTTYGYNGALFWGPTLIMNQGDVVQINVTNKLTSATTVHWHGFHLPAVMDGGPLQPVPAGTTWSPTWKVLNNAATYWYHPHLHETTQEQLTKGAGGFIIVKDPQEAALALPRTYGVDDIPLGITSRRFLTGNSFAYDHVLDNYGDYVVVNGTLSPQATLPKQFVRLRLLNAEVERGYNVGFSDNRTFYVITNDSGLLNAPVAVTRVKLMVGERVEILVNLGGDAVGAALDLKAFNSGQAFGFPGNEGNPVQPTGRSGPINGSLLNNTDFNLLHIVVGATTANAITALPTALANNSYWTNANVTNSRTVTITGGNGGAEFSFDNLSYTGTRNNFSVKLNDVEKWTIVNNNVFGHAFHIHDVKFKIVARTPTNGQVSSDGLAAPYESGWKDTVYVPRGESVQVIAKFEDYASTTNAFMFHCHFLNHEDGGMMGQFIVYDPAVVTDIRPPAFIRQPRSLEARPGENVRLIAAVGAPAGTTYAWYFRGGEFCNTTEPVLALNNITAAYAGDYTCVATNAFGSTTSAAATLALNFEGPAGGPMAGGSSPAEAKRRVVSRAVLRRALAQPAPGPAAAAIEE